jgi:hypothetical protein
VKKQSSSKQRQVLRSFIQISKCLSERWNGTSIPKKAQDVVTFSVEFWNIAGHYQVPHSDQSEVRAYQTIVRNFEMYESNYM